MNTNTHWKNISRLALVVSNYVAQLSVQIYVDQAGHRDEYLMSTRADNATLVHAYHSVIDNWTVFKMITTIL